MNKKQSMWAVEEISDDDDKDIEEMQREVEDILSKITAKKRKTTNTNQVPLQFSVKVKVEECNETPQPQPNKPVQNNINITNNPNSLLKNSQEKDSAVEDREYYLIIKKNGMTLSETPPSTSQENTVLKPSPTNLNDDYKLQNRSEETYYLINNAGNEIIQELPLYNDKNKHFTFSNNQIKDEMEKLSMSSTNPVDKHIHMLVKNMVNVPTAVKKTPQELALEKVLLQWRNWYLEAPDIREAPLQYKCRTCGVAWWHYYEFQEHLETQHKAYNVHMTLKFQAAHHESYIIARKKYKSVKKTIITTPCLRCGLSSVEKCKNYDVCTRTYRCRCGSEEPTCTLYRLHLDVCKINNPKRNDGVIYKCHLCFFKFTSSGMLTVHKILSHSVRSDLPCAWPKYVCKLCNIPLENIGWHDCPKMKQDIMCRYCPKRFTAAPFLNLHYNFVKDNVKCRYCDHVMSKGCMELEHLIKHTNNYKLLYKCTVCEDNKFFLGSNYYNIHLLAKHPSIDKTASMVPVPVRCLEMAGYTDPLRKILPRAKRTRENKNKTLETTTVKTKMKYKDFNPNETINIEDEDDNIEEYINNYNEIDEMILNRNNENPETVLDEKEIKKEAEFLNDTKEIKQESSDSKDVYENIDIKKEHDEDKDNIDKDMNILADINDLISDDIKMEVKEELDDIFYEDDIIILNGNNIGHVNLADDPVNDDVDSENKDDGDDDYEMDNDDNSDDSDTATRRRTYQRLYTCKQCNFEGTYNLFKLHKEKHIKEKIRRKKKTFAVENNLKCSRCKKKFGTLRLYLLHLVTHNYPEFTCPCCMEKLPHLNKLIVHVSKEISKSLISVRAIRTTEGDRTFKYQCKKCQKNVKASDSFQHWEKHLVMPKNKLNDSNWEKFAPEEPLLRECIALLLGVPYMNVVDPVMQDPSLRCCKVCKKSFDRRNDLKRHYIQHLLDDAYSNVVLHKGLRCQICGQVFTKTVTYKSHMRYHASLPVYKCDLCNKLFSDSSNFAKHDKVHNNSALTCDICKKKFNVKHQLIRHLKNHETMTPIVCNVEDCKRICYGQSSYKRHCRVSHLKEKFTCMICKEKFISLRDKWDHQWTIHNHREIVADCPVCAQPFRMKSDVKRHMQAAHPDASKDKRNTKRPEVIEDAQEMEAIDEEEELEEVTEVTSEPYVLCS